MSGRKKKAEIEDHENRRTAERKAEGTEKDQDARRRNTVRFLKKVEREEKQTQCRRPWKLEVNEQVGTQSAQVGHPGVESVSRATYISTPSKLVFSSSGIEVTSEHAVISEFSAESSVPVQGTSCVDRAVSHGLDRTVSGGSCGKDTSPAHLARSQPGVGTQCAHVGYPGVELVSRATYISRKKLNLETVQRQSKALKKSSTGCETQVCCAT